MALLSPDWDGSEKVLTLWPIVKDSPVPNSVPTALGSFTVFSRLTSESEVVSVKSLSMRSAASWAAPPTAWVREATKAA